MTSLSGLPWTPDAIAEAVAMKRSGQSASAIAETLGRSRNAVIGQLNRTLNGYKRPYRRDFIQREDAMQPNFRKDDSCLRALWLAVIERHARDALGDFGDTVRGGPTLKAAAMVSARQWLESEQFEFACTLADVDPDCIFGMIAEKIRSGDTVLGWRPGRVKA